MTKLGKRLPPLGCLITFDAAFRHGSFTRAADELALSQASVSRQIRLLETNLGFPLFERRRYDVIPTEEGKILAESVANSLRDIAQTTDKLRARFDKGETLGNQPLLHFKQPARDWPDWRTFLAEFGAELSMPLQGLEFSSYAVYLDVTENGEGIALGWGRQIMTRLSSGRLIRITEMSMRLPQNISIYLKRHDEKHPLTQSFINYLRENVDGLPA